MRLNPKIYQLGEGYEPFETQEFDGRLVELYYMDDFDAVYNQNVQKGKFALWTSANGKDYRLFIEKGFHEEVKPLYSMEVNKIWLDFWDKCDDVTSKFNFRILLPIALVCLVIFFVVSTLWGSQTWSMYVQLGILVLFMVGLFMANKFTKNKINALNKESVDEIKAVLTDEGFNEVLDKQKNYMDEFFARKQAEIDAELAEDEENSDERYADDEIEETTADEEVVEASEEVEETAVSEEKVEENNSEEDIKE